MRNVKLERKRQFSASCKTSSWSPCRIPTVLPFGQTTANLRAQSLWSVMSHQYQARMQLLIQESSPAMPSLPTPLPFSASHLLALSRLKSMTLCLELRNYWATQTPIHIAPGTFLGLSQTQMVGPWIGAVLCVSCVGNMWAVVEEQWIFKTIWPTSTTSNYVKETGNEY